MIWKSIYINANLIETEFDKAVLIKMPHNSDYNGYCFWHTLKLVRHSKHSNTISIGYTNDFTFRLKKYGKGKYNRKEVISEIEIGAEEFETAFSNIPQKQNPYETHKPVKIDTTRVKVLEELKDE